MPHDEEEQVRYVLYWTDEEKYIQHLNRSVSTEAYDCDAGYTRDIEKARKYRSVRGVLTAIQRAHRRVDSSSYNSGLTIRKVVTTTKLVSVPLD